MKRVSRGFVLAYVAAQVSTFVGFAPFLSILLPLKVQAVQTAGKDVLLSELLLVGAVAASIANVVAGGLSDRTPVRFGHRRPWLIGGALGTAASFWIIETARTEAALLAGVVLLQVFLNAILAPLSAVIADRVPETQRGSVAGWLSLSYPSALLIGSFLVGGVFHRQGLRYAALAAVVLCGVAPFAGFVLRKGAEASRASAVPATVPIPRRVSRFLWLWAARFLMQCAIAPATGYLLFYLEDVLGERHPAARVALLTSVSAIAAMVAAPLCGLVSDRRGSRRGFALAGAIAAAAGLGLLAAGRGWAGAVGGVTLVGAGFGGFTAMDTALAAHLAASAKGAGRELGVLNLAHTVPQMLMPLVALAALGTAGKAHDYAVLFGLCAGLALLSGLAIQAVQFGGDPAEARMTSSKGSITSI